MKRYLSFLLTIVLFWGINLSIPEKIKAEDNSLIKESVIGSIYELDEKSDYNLSTIDKDEPNNSVVNRVSLTGDIQTITNDDGTTSYVIRSGNANITIDLSQLANLYKKDDSGSWYIINDNGKQVDNAHLEEKIRSGAVIIQTSKDGISWVTADYETDICNKLDTINSRVVDAEDNEVPAFYQTTNVQLVNGCNYRVLIAYKMQKVVDPSKKIKQRETADFIEVYNFKADDPTIDKDYQPTPEESYQYSDVYRVKDQEGFENPVKIKSDDPHAGWQVGAFYISDFTDKIQDEDGNMIFLKTPGDKISLWFKLENDINKCDDNPDIWVEDTSSGYDINFNSKTISHIGHGMVSITRTDNNNHKETQRYLNYLEASATVEANTRIDVFEEGDYEVALDYQIHYKKPFVFGSKFSKVLSYTVPFKFKIRNGDISNFIREAGTGRFIENGNETETGFYVDVAGSKYLRITIERKTYSKGIDGLIAEPELVSAAKENEVFSDKGIYSVKVLNPTTGNLIERTVYVGNRDVLLANIATGLPMSEIEEKLEQGYTIDQKGNLTAPSEPESEAEPESELIEEPPSEAVSETEAASENKTDELVSETNTQDTEYVNQATTDNKPVKVKNRSIIIAIVVVIVVVGISSLLVLLRKRGKAADNNKEC